MIISVILWINWTIMFTWLISKYYNRVMKSYGFSWWQYTYPIAQNMAGLNLMLLHNYVNLLKYSYPKIFDIEWVNSLRLYNTNICVFKYVQYMDSSGVEINVVYVDYFTATVIQILLSEVKKCWFEWFHFVLYHYSWVVVQAQSNTVWLYAVKLLQHDFHLLCSWVTGMSLWSHNCQ